MNWESKDTTLIIGNIIAHPFIFKKKLACFDLDGTLIKTKSGKKFPKDENDWIFFSNNVQSKIKELHKNNYSIIIITNQAGLSVDNKLTIWKKKITNIFHELNLPIKIFSSIAHNIYRKPFPTIMNELIFPYTPDIDLINSFYCGDACGRDKDHSDCDLKFAINSKLKFILPEVLFDNSKINDIPPINYPPFDEINNKQDKKIVQFNSLVQNKEILLMIGYPGSGKSSFVNNILIPLNYFRVNRDTLVTQAKCLKETKKGIDKGLNIVIDNTNASKKNRADYLKLAKMNNYEVRCICINTSYLLSFHNSNYRAIKNKQTPIPEIAFRLYRKNYCEPSLNEGIKEIINIDHIFNNPDPLYKLYLF